MDIITRRHMGFVLAAVAGSSAHAQTATGGTSIHQEVDFPASPQTIYQALSVARQFSAFTKLPAEIEPTEGGAFKLFGGLIEGRNVELLPGRRIVQAWRPASWPQGVYSIVRFELAAHGSGTRIILDHAGFTADKWPHLNEGWSMRYWEPLRSYLA